MSLEQLSTEETVLINNVDSAFCGFFRATGTLLMLLLNLNIIFTDEIDLSIRVAVEISKKGNLKSEQMKSNLSK